MRGFFRIYRDGELFIESENVVTTGALVSCANLAAGVTTGQFVSLMGYGNGTATPQQSDTGLSGNQQYFNAITGSTFPSSGAVSFNFSLSGSDYGAVPGLTITEIGLFANSSGVQVPISKGIVTATWQPSTAYAVGAIILDANGNVQRCTTAGTSGASQPTWSTVVGNTTADNTVVWTNVADSTLPTPIWTHALVPSFAFNGQATYTGTYILTF